MLCDLFYAIKNVCTLYWSQQPSTCLSSLSVAIATTAQTCPSAAAGRTKLALKLTYAEEKAKLTKTIAQPLKTQHWKWPCVKDKIYFI